MKNTTSFAAHRTLEVIGLGRCAVDFYAQFAFLGIFIIVFVVTLFRVPKLDEEQLDDDLREEEEEGLLASTGRRFGATWQDITGRAKGEMALT